MHGVMLCGFRGFVIDAYGDGAWEAVLTDADVAEQLFVPVTDYPDVYYDELVDAAASYADRDAAALQRDFGRALVERRLGGHCCPLEDDVTGLRRLERFDVWVESWFEPVGVAKPPLSLGTDRLDERRIRIADDSPHGLCNVVRGLVDGLGEFAEVGWDVDEASCVHQGAAECAFVVSVGRESAATSAGCSGAPEVTD